MHLEKEIDQLKGENEKLKDESTKKDIYLLKLEDESKKIKTLEQELEKKDIYMDNLQRKHIISVRKKLNSLLDFMKEESTQPVIVGELPSLKFDYVRWYFFIYGKVDKNSQQMEVGVSCILSNYSTGTGTNDTVKQKEMEKHLKKNNVYNTYINMNKISDIIKAFKNIINVGFVDSFIVPED